MSNDNTTIETEIQNTLGDVVYQRDLAQATPQPEFKPGDTPHTQLGNQTLNGNVPWSSIVEEIFQACYTQEQLLAETGITAKDLQKISHNNYKKLSFRSGARLLRVHSMFYPEQYI